VYARTSLKKLFRDDFDATSAVLATLEALYDAADDDSATGGPDLSRRIFPVVAVVDADGYRRLDDDELGGLVERVVGARMTRPDGPAADLPQA
jgi:proteasome beta subunit